MQELFFLQTSKERYSTREKYKKKRKRLTMKPLTRQEL